jgi:hypothetical protein
VKVGLTVLELPVTVPTFVMDKEVAPVTPQDKVEDCPEVIVLGEAEKEVMVGTEVNIHV